MYQVLYDQTVTNTRMNGRSCAAATEGIEGQEEEEEEELAEAGGKPEDAAAGGEYVGGKVVVYHTTTHTFVGVLLL